MLITLQDAKDKFNFCLTNFCVMPTHIHLLIKPEEGTGLIEIMRWLKTRSAKRWNFIHGSTDHMWGNRYFARAIKDNEEYEAINDYIDQNPVKAGLAASPEEWKASAAFYKKHEIPGLVDLFVNDSRKEIILLPAIPFSISRLIPPAQLDHIMRYMGAYAAMLDRLYNLLQKIPNINETEIKAEQKTYLHYYTNTHNYFISGYDRDDTMYGKVCSICLLCRKQVSKIKFVQTNEKSFSKTGGACHSFFVVYPAYTNLRTVSTHKFFTKFALSFSFCSMVCC